MILEIHGKLKPYYVQTLAMIFFPGVKFPEGEGPSPDTPMGTVTLDEDERRSASGIGRPPLPPPSHGIPPTETATASGKWRRARPS